MSDDAASIAVTTITITRTFHPDRTGDAAETIRVDVDGEPTLVDTLGMLEFAKVDLIAPAIRSDDDDG